jgi:predicted acylesterase/phospholipase RssA
MITSCTLKEVPPVRTPPVVQPPPKPAKITLVLGAGSSKGFAHIGSADFLKRHEAILEGEKAALEALPQIMEIITQLRTEGRLE